MSDSHRFITPEGLKHVEAVFYRFTEYPEDPAREAARDLFSHIEGERPCERCRGTGKVGKSQELIIPEHECPDCEGTGSVTDDPLLRLSEVTRWLRAASTITGPHAAADYIERMAKEGRFDG